MRYYLKITYPGSGTEILMNTGERAIASTEENRDLLVGMGNRLLKENVISGYQLLVTVGEEFNRTNIFLGEQE